MKDEALRLALEALQSGDYWKGVEAVNAIKQALEQPEPEILGWATHHDEPMLFPTRKEAVLYCEDDEEPRPLYTSPPKREPLTDEQKLALCKQFPDHLTFNAIKAIEAALGIKGGA